LNELRKEKSPEDEENRDVITAAELWAVLKRKEHWNSLIGTGGTWFLYDYCFYGTALFSPNIVNNIFGDSGNIIANCWQNIVANMMGIPGLLIAILLLRSL